ncbi:MAG TPA: hypothetical protein VEZ55_08595, partial [Chitinophagaceae bacterium]|nr:hypothetical protein [Chitinophagaceae bacterium]
HQNSPTRFQMAPKDGKAMMMLMLAQGKSVQEAANAAMQQYKLQPVDSREVSVNGLPAMAVVADQRQQQGGVIRTLSYFIQYGGNMYHIIGVSSLNDFNAYTTFFNNTMQNFRELTDASKINKKPERIRVKTVNQEGTLEQVLRRYNVTDKRLSELALVNGMNLTDRVTAGTMIKVIEQ